LGFGEGATTGRGFMMLDDNARNDACSEARTHPAVVLLGPTGSGKTPLGDLLEERGLWRAGCLHFDFGANLRRIASRNRPDEQITRADLEFLREVLDRGALLEDEHFPLAERILRSFLVERGAEEQALIILNGLPRHVGQADALDAMADVRAVVLLQCSSDVVLARIGANVGGDRTGREDDHAHAIRQKLEVFNRRTAPLVDHYRARGVPIETIEVTSAITAAEMWRILDGIAAFRKSNLV
jgi:adenylate kinase